MPLWQGLAVIVIVWTSTQMALSSDGLNLAAVVRMVIGLSISLGMPRFYTAPLPGTSYKAMEVEADPLDPPPSSSGNGPSPRVRGNRNDSYTVCSLGSSWVRPSCRGHRRGTRDWDGASPQSGTVQFKWKRGRLGQGQAAGGHFVTLSEVRVGGLFGRFDHEIVFPKNEHVTIMIAPNGFGKTMILRIINVLFNQGVRGLAKLPFHEVSVRFDDGSHLRVTRTVPSEPTSKKSKPVMHVAFKNDVFEEAFTPPELPLEEFNFPLAMIDEWVQVLDRVGPNSWRNMDTGEQLNLEKVIERYGHTLPGEFQSAEGTPEWFSDLQQRVSIRFVDVERLTHRFQDNEFHRRRRGARSEQRTVLFYSHELGDKIQQTLTEYGSLSQSLDQTFPARLVKQPMQSRLTMDQLRNELAQVESKRSQLIGAGLLQQEHTGLNVTVPDIEEVDESRREVLAMFARDTKEKLSVFDEILTKVDTLKRIANARFLHKRVAVSERGILVTTPDGQPLNLEMLSSGEQHELVMLYDLLFRVSTDALIMIDEPELSLHVAWQEKFLDDIDDIAKLSNFRVLLATHSPQIIGDRYNLAIELKGPVGDVAAAADSNR